MNTETGFLERNHRAIIFSLAFIIVFFAASCTFHDLIPICHYVFGCDHQVHVAL
jgi:hypothetical protein